MGEHKRLLGLSAAALIACTSDGDSRASGDGGSGIGTLTASSDTGGTSENEETDSNSSAPTSSASGTSQDDDGGWDGGPTLFDLGELPDAAVNEGCKAVDFLFIVDNSGSMQSVQSNLINNFPAFINGIQSTLVEVDSYQVGVVTTDAYSSNADGCKGIGALVTKTGGNNSSNSVCGPFAAGKRFMTEADDLSSTFSCTAQVGTSGSGYERPMDALVAVASKSMDVPNGCNEGFIRDDALLVIVVITDEYDGPNDPEGQGSSGLPQDWYNAVVALKGGLPQNAVVLTLTNYYGGPCPPPGGQQYYDGVHLVEFTQLFGDNGFVGGICESDYGPIFEEAIGVIQSACEKFEG